MKAELKSGICILYLIAVAPPTVAQDLDPFSAVTRSLGEIEQRRQAREQEDLLPVLPQVQIQGNPYTEPQKPFADSPLSPQYLFDPYEGKFRRIR